MLHVEVLSLGLGLSAFHRGYALFAGLGGVAGCRRLDWVVCVRAKEGLNDLA